MQVQQLNDNTNFRAITSYKIRGTNFKKAPEMGQKLLERIVPNKKLNFPNESVRIVIKDWDFRDFWTSMLLGITSEERKHYYNNTIMISIYKNLKGNVFSKTWEHIKNIVSLGENLKPYVIRGAGNTFEDACTDTMHLLQDL